MFQLFLQYTFLYHDLWALRYATVRKTSSSLKSNLSITSFDYLNRPAIHASICPSKELIRTSTRALPCLSVAHKTRYTMFRLTCYCCSFLYILCFVFNKMSNAFFFLLLRRRIWGSGLINQDVHGWVVQIVLVLDLQ